MSAEPIGVTIAVPTFRRPDDLRSLIPLLQDQAAEASAGGRYAVDVLVVDNDPVGSAAEAADAFPGVRYVGEPRPGIAVVRNRALDEASGSLLAFIDDDERPCPGWLAELLATWTTTGAAAVSGRVLADYAGDLDPWIRAGDFFVRRRMPTGSEIDVAAAGNLLLDLRQVRGSGVRFESALGLGGGEDTLFSRSLARAGGRMVWSDESAVVDRVPLERMTRRWVLTRAWSHGNASVLTDLRLSRGPADRVRIRVRSVARGLVRMGGGGARWCWGTVRGSLRHRARGLRAVLRGAGMVGGGLGVVYEEYARSGRRWRLARVVPR
ncbi:glycosyltransferase family 2 protein [Modestobacter roseus]|uniref:GT2 family glycosyltransferase n=1 Tax=Modestobacter roseus TaxID=1181884 RepID=A0A562IKS0_9ACTN|nr:glycosyltransferase family 2 protein [Modestobacter roseus]MQA32807.1 glycosyltransferase [Modestobacter roseus]TWH71540.1 GT2 family glycosyltransferase [Modestobacter roseus]